MKNSDKIKILTFGKAQGIRGEIRVQLHLDNPQTLQDLMPLYDDKGKEYFIEKIRQQNTVFIAKIKHISDRTQAEQLTNSALFVDKNKLPKNEENEFYYDDLIGLDVKYNGSDEVVGEILRVVDFGAGDLLEIQYNANLKSEYHPFTLDYVPEIDIENGFISINPLLFAPDDDLKSQHDKTS